MMPRGIPIAQIESSLENDERVKVLALMAPDRMTYLAQLGAYTSIVLQAWATASRDVGAMRSRLIPQPVIDALVEVGLLDADGAIPEPTFEKWVGSVLDASEERRERFAELASRGGQARAKGDRDKKGRLLPVQPQPADAQQDPADTAGPIQQESSSTAGSTQPSSSRTAGAPSLEESKSRPEDSSSSPSSAEEEEDAQVSTISAPRTESEWLAHIVEKDPTPRPGKTGRLLGEHAERTSRLADYFQERFGRPFDSKDGGRLAALVKGDEGGYTVVMAAIAEAAARDPKGDPIDYITSILQRRASRGKSANGNGSRFAPNDNDYDARAAERLAAGV